MKKVVDQGFTIVELMIATAIFAVILVLTTTTIIGISQTYIKGSVQNQTQQSARAILSDISDDLEFNQAVSVDLSGLASPSHNNVYYFCVGNDVYVYQMDMYLSSSKVGSEYSPWGLIRYSSSCPKSANVPDCVSACGGGLISFPAGYSELISSNERVGQIYITPNTINGVSAYSISVEVAYGENTLLNDNGTVLNIDGSSTTNSNFINNVAAAPSSSRYVYKCATGLDSSFCAITTLTTTVAPRITN